jgi:Arc/MetJ family transcription regulator
MRSNNEISPQALPKPGAQPSSPFLITLQTTGSLKSLNLTSADTMSQNDAQKYSRVVYNHSMRTNIDINDSLVRKARKLTRLKTKRQIVDKALELLVRSESRKGILRYYGSGIWKGDLKAMRRNRV